MRLSFLGLLLLLPILSHTDAPINRKAYLRGKEVFMQRCQFCHGENADGKGSLSAHIPDPKPRDFRQKEIALLPTEGLKRTITEGGQAVGRNPMMPAWGTVLTDEEVSDVIVFIQTVSRFGRVPSDAEVMTSQQFSD